MYAKAKGDFEKDFFGQAILIKSVDVVVCK